MFLTNFQGTYDPAKVIVTIGQNIVTGFSDNDFIRVTFDEDRYRKVTGADGEVTRVRNASQAGVVEITLLSSAPSNSELSALINNPDAVTIGINDLSGESVMLASRCWVKKPPDMVFGKEITDRVWTFDCADIQMDIGGTTNNSVLGMIAGLF